MAAEILTNMLAWQWKANGGTTSSNTDGDITSTVQADTTAGFSIMTYTGTTGDVHTIGHGLGVTPDALDCKTKKVMAETLMIGSFFGIKIWQLVMLLTTE